MKILAMIFITLVIAEFGIHIIYHAITGKAGFEDPAFSYLVDIYRQIRNKISNRILYRQVLKVLKKNSFVNAYNIEYNDIYDFRKEKSNESI